MIGQHLWADLDIAIGQVCGNYGINGKIEAIIYRCGWRMARVYVYVHRQLSNGQVFYVGKGHGKRAWEKKRRHKKWLEWIATLGDDWEVAIVRDDLSEFEAFAWEEELTIQFGGAAFDGGTLANQIPGGENPVSASITVDLGERLGCWIEVYEATRKFHDLSQDECQVFVDRLMNDLRSIVNKLEEINESDPPEAIADSVLDLDGIVGSLIDNGDEFLRHRIGWEDFRLAWRKL